MNLDFYINMAFGVVIPLLQETIPNDPKSKSKWKKAFVKIARLMGEAYPNDKEIQNAFEGAK
jgi:hypothetical protein